MKQATLVLLFFLCLSPSLYAQNNAPDLDKGTRELGLSGTFEIQEFEDIDFDIDATFGYFFSDGWEVGVRAIGADVSGVERFDFSVFSEYNFNRSSNIVPYLGASVGIAEVDFQNLNIDSTLAPNDEDATVFSIQGGIKWFLRPYMAITTSIAFNVSTDDIYEADNELKDNLTRIRLGMRYYF